MIGLLILVPIVTMSLFAPYITPYDVTEQDVTNRFADPSLEHPMGTDQLGRDLLSRVMVGGRTSLFLGVSATALGLLLGVPPAIVAAYAGGRVDEVVMRTVDILISVPGLLFALLILTVLSSSVWNAILAIGFVFAPRITRVVRGSALSVKEEEFVKAAQARGESDAYIVFGEILPNVMAPITVEASIRVGFAILFGTSLSFLGLGTQPPNPDWGYMVAQAREHMWSSVWPLVWPSVVLVLTVVGFNALGDGLRDLLDPQSRGES
jgi:peptide/nickel transport system permease protein